MNRVQLERMIRRAVNERLSEERRVAGGLSQAQIHEIIDGKKADAKGSKRWPQDRFSVVRATRALARKDWSGASYERKALGVSQLAEGGAFTTDELADEIIELLRPMTVVLNIPGVQRVDPSEASISFPRVNEGSQAFWLGENEDIPQTELRFGQVQLSPKTLAAIVPISNQLLMDASVSAENVVRQDLAQTLAVSADLAYLVGTGTQNQPLGFTQVEGITVDDQAGASLAYDTLIDAMVAVSAADATPNAWVAHPRTKGGLLKL